MRTPLAEPPASRFLGVRLTPEELETLGQLQQRRHLTSRSEVVVTFLALLELIRLRQLVARQAAPFSEIEIGLASAEVPAEAPRPGPAADAPLAPTN